jgi:hypothetical protein
MVRVRLGFSIRVRFRVRLGFSMRVRIRVQIWKYLSPPRNWEVTKEIYVLLNTKIQNWYVVLLTPKY